VEQKLRVQFPVGARDLSILHSIVTGSGTHPDSSAMGIGGSFLRSKETGA
jgi:hypothetical protein